MPKLSHYQKKLRITQIIQKQQDSLEPTGARGLLKQHKLFTLKQIYYEYLDMTDEEFEEEIQTVKRLESME